MANRPSTPVEIEITADAVRELPLVALRETVIFPEMIVPLQVGRDKSVAGAQRRRRRRLADRAGHPAPGRPGGHHRPVRAVPDRHAGQDRPGRPAPGRHGSRHRPGPAAPAPARLRRDRAVHPGAHRELADESPSGPRGPGAGAHGPGPDRAVRPAGAPVPPEAAVAARNITEPGLLADMVAYSPDMTTEQRQELLETIDVPERLKLVSSFLAGRSRSSS